MQKQSPWLLMMVLCFPGCAPSPEEVKAGIKTDPSEFESYWRQGKAELSRYRLKQARYGEIHKGDAVLIFVTEDLLKDLQVKRDFGKDPADLVLKLNFTRKFDTGLYPYSLMSSIFTKVDFKQPITPKITFSGQEWCGHVFMQLNRKQDHYAASLRSYFQSEGDRDFQIPITVLEDELWTMIRIAPDNLPLGEISLIPGLQYARLSHQEAAPHPARATLTVATNRDISKHALYRYEIVYQDLDRTLSIYFERESPYRIMGWQETYMSGFGDSAKKLTTTAVQTHSLFIDYWNKNKNKDRALRKELGLK